jgi:hypothetical protein
MAFAALLAFILLLGLTSRRATRGTYLVIAAAAIVASAWEYLA